VATSGNQGEGAELFADFFGALRVGRESRCSQCAGQVFAGRVRATCGLVQLSEPGRRPGLDRAIAQLPAGTDPGLLLRFIIVWVDAEARALGADVTR
jgi:hypothetical protein